MELTRVVVALLVGAWSLLAQFVFNRIIFFYVANSEYTAAAIITIHLAGFGVGAAWARRRSGALLPLMSAALAWMVLVETLVWRLGLLVFGLPVTIAMAALGGLVLATLSGAIVVRLMGLGGKRGYPEAIVVADTAGSVAGALVGGFFVLPVLGIQAGFAAVEALQLLALVVLMAQVRSRAVAAALAVGGVALLVTMAGMPSLAEVRSDRVVAADGMVVMEKSQGAEAALLDSAKSPFGLLTVVRNGDEHILSVDGRQLCLVGRQGPVGSSEWEVGVRPLRALDPLDKEKPVVANIGLGCGMTMAGMLGALSAKARLDVIELNPEMARMQAHFRPLLPHGVDDPRVKLVVADGFRYFAERTPDITHPPYDAVAIDVAWMQNMNATHLFSVEMYENVRRNLKPRGIVSVWTEEANPFSPVSLIIYQSLKAVFPNVEADIVGGVVLFYASPERNNLANFNSERGREISNWMEDAAQMASENRLDNLIMNRYKFTPWGDSTWERLYRKYDHLTL